MQQRAALVLAVVFGAAAVAVVAADIMFSLEVRLEAQREDGTWASVASTGFHGPSRPYPAFAGCAGPDLRLVVDNGRLVGARTDVEVRWHAYETGSSGTLVEERVHVPQGEQRVMAFRVPAAAFQAPTAPGSDAPPTAFVEARVGEHFLTACVQEAV